MPQKQTIFFHSTNHPCTENAMNMNLLKRYYAANDWRQNDNPYTADHIIVSTCGFSQGEEDYELKVINDYNLNKKSGARLILTGCLPLISKDNVERIFQGDYVQITNMKDFDAITNFNIKIDYFNNNHVSVHEYDTDPSIHKYYKIRKATEKYSFLPFVKLPKTFYTVPSDNWFIIRGSMGCTGNCSYCGIKNAHGPIKSESVESIVELAKEGLAQGYKEIAISGPDTGAYGVDRKTSLPELLEALFMLPGDFKINFRYIDPKWLIKLKNDLMPFFKTGRITSFCSPIQSGSNRILELMNRKYTYEEHKEAVNTIIRKTKVKMISTNIMVGFPGETVQDFNDSMRVVREMDFAMYMVFKCSHRPGTKAFSFPGRLTEEEMDRRYNIMSKAVFKKHLKVILTGRY